MMFLVVEGPRSVRLVTSAQMITDETLTGKISVTQDAREHSCEGRDPTEA